MNDFASANLTAGQLNAVVKMLGGEEGTLRFLRGETVVKTISPTKSTEFKIWKTIKLRAGMDATAYCKAIKGKKVGDSEMRIGNYANDILEKPKFTVVTEETELDLIVLSVKELTGKTRASLKEIFSCAKTNGLHLCPNQAGPELRLQYEDQPKGEWLVIGMEPISGSVGGLRLFGVAYDGRVLWLYTDFGSPDLVWDDNDRFVFVLPRK